MGEEPSTPRVRAKPPLSEKSSDQLRSTDSPHSGSSALDILYRMNHCAAGWGVGLWLELARGCVYFMLRTCVGLRNDCLTAARFPATAFWCHLKMRAAADHNYSLARWEHLALSSAQCGALCGCNGRPPDHPGPHVHAPQPSQEARPPHPVEMQPIAV